MPSVSAPAARAAAPDVTGQRVAACLGLRPTRIASAVQLAMLGGLLLAGQPVALAQTAPAAQPASPVQQGRAYDIPAGPLGEVLARFARESGALLAAAPEQVHGRTSPGLRGSYSVQGALATLLAGSGLEAARQADGSYVLKKAPGAEANGDTLLPGITVSARRDTPLQARQERGYRVRSSAVSGFREQEVLDTPFSTATISAEVIEDQQARSLADLVKNDPSVTLAGDPHWFERVNVRGFGLSVDAVYRDGLSINDQGTIALENKAAVEFNKGLSALRYGATSPGGVVNYVIKRPTEEPLRTINVSTDSNGAVGAHADLGGRFGDQGEFGYRINIAAEELRSHVDAFEGDKQFISGFFDWRVNDRLSLELDLEYQQMDKLSVRTPYLWWWGWNEDAAAVAAAQAAFPRLGPEIYAAQDWAMEPNEQTYVAARAHYQINDDWKATVAAHRSSLWRDQNSSSVWDVVAPDGEYEADIYYSPDQERNNEALQVVFQGDLQLGSMRHELAFGYDRIERDMSFPAGVYQSIGFDNLFNPRGLPRPPVGPADAGPSYIANRTRQQSWFITDNLVVNDHWSVFGGLRHTDIEQYRATSAASPLQKTYDQSSVNPTVGLVYKPVPEGTLYVSYAEGIELGGVVSGANYTNNGEQLPPLTSEQYEAGVKWEIGRDALLTAAVFQIDKGLTLDRNNGDGTRTRLQDGRQVHRGVEVTASGQVTRNLRLLAGIAYLDAEIEKTSNAALIGKKPQGVPDWQANLYADYALGSWLPGLSVNAGLYYGGRKAVDPGNLWLADSYVRLDAGVKYAHRLGSDKEVTYRLNVENLTDEKYLESTTWGALQFGAPLTVYASASLSF